MTNYIQVAVAKADLAITKMASLPWGRIGLSVIAAVAVVYVVSKAHKERRDAR